MGVEFNVEYLSHILLIKSKSGVLPALKEKQRSYQKAWELICNTVRVVLLHWSIKVLCCSYVLLLNILLYIWFIISIHICYLQSHLSCKTKIYCFLNIFCWIIPWRNKEQKWKTFLLITVEEEFLEENYPHILYPCLYIL